MFSCPIIFALGKMKTVQCAGVIALFIFFISSRVFASIDLVVKSESTSNTDSRIRLFPQISTTHSTPPSDLRVLASDGLLFIAWSNCLWKIDPSTCTATNLVNNCTSTSYLIASRIGPIWMSSETGVIEVRTIRNGKLKEPPLFSMGGALQERSQPLVVDDNIVFCFRDEIAGVVKMCSVSFLTGEILWVDKLASYPGQEFVELNHMIFTGGHSLIVADYMQGLRVEVELSDELTANRSLLTHPPSTLFIVPHYISTLSSGDYCFVGFDTGALFAIDPTDLTVQSILFGGPASYATSIGDSILAVSNGAQLYRLHLEESLYVDQLQAVLPSTDFGYRLWGSDNTYVLASTDASIVVPYRYPEVPETFLIMDHTGKVLWQWQEASGYKSKPLLLDGNVYYVDGSQRFMIIDIEDNLV